MTFRCILNHFGLRYCRFRVDPDFSGNSADHLKISHIKVDFACLEVSNRSESIKNRFLAGFCVLEKCRKIIGAKKFLLFNFKIPSCSLSTFNVVFVNLQKIMNAENVMLFPINMVYFSLRLIAPQVTLGLILLDSMI